MVAICNKEKYYKEFIAFTKDQMKEYIQDQYKLDDYFFFNPEEACDYVIIVEYKEYEERKIFIFTTDDLVTETDLMVRISMLN
jgi:hypothetical protein